MRQAAIAGMMLMTMACAPVPPAEEPMPVQGGGTCDASKAQALVGREATSQLGQEALRISGAATLRWISPGAMVTMDYREDRLNIETDAQNRVTRIRCG